MKKLLSFLLALSLFILPVLAGSGSAKAETTIEDVLDALNNSTYRSTYNALKGGEEFKNGSKGDTAKGVQQTLADFGQDITVDGKAGKKTFSTLNTVQEAFGLDKTSTLDADGYATLLSCLVFIKNPDEAESLFYAEMGDAEFNYNVACSYYVQNKYYTAKKFFEQSEYNDYATRASKCVQSFPKNGVMFKESIGKENAKIKVVNKDETYGMHVEIWTTDDVLARTMFIRPKGNAMCPVPAGNYYVKTAYGTEWFGDEAFGDDSSYSVRYFDGEADFEVKKQYLVTLTLYR